MSVNLIDPAWPVAAVDLHQHLWPEALVDRLRARSRFPYLRGWTLHTQGEAPYEIDPAHHVVADRLRQDAHDGIGLACVSLSAPLGHRVAARAVGAGPAGRLARGGGRPARRLLRLGVGLVAGAGPRGSRGPARRRVRRRPGARDRRRDAGRLGALGSRAGRRRGPGVRSSCTRDRWRRTGTRRRCRTGGRLSSGTPRSSRPRGGPGTRGACGHRTRASGRVRGRRRVRARAPRATRRAGRYVGTGRPARARRHVVVRASGPRALVRVLGIDALVLGSDRPYAAPVTDLWGDAATRAVRVTNPRRVLGLPVAGVEGVRSWPRAS